MKISIVIVNWNVSKLLQACLASIEKYGGDAVKEVIVVDNASKDDSVEMVKKKFPTVKVIANTRNLGFAAANNQGIAQAKGEYVLLLNPDTELRSHTLKYALECAKDNKRIGILGCKHLNTDLTLQHSVRRFPNLVVVLLILTKFARLIPGLKLLRHYYAKDFDYHVSQKATQVQGSFFMLNRELIDEIGPLDDQFFIWFEEVDYCKRAIAHDWLVYYCAQAEIIHHGGSSFSQRMTINKQILFAKSAWRYFKKHGFFTA